MNSLSSYLANYGSSFQYENIPVDIVHKIKRHLIDSLACAVGGYDSEPAKIAIKLAGQVTRCNMPAAVWGTRRKSTPELAAFANGVMVRYLDFNDGYVSKGRGHPSDNFAPILTCGDAAHASGKEIIAAALLAYEIFCRIYDQFNPGAADFDQALIGVISSVIGVSKIFRLSEEQMAEAINLAIVPNVALQQTRTGVLSMWKGAALANSGRNAVFAALLAKEGMTGPAPVFEGRCGLFKVIGGPFQIKELGGNGRPYRIQDVMIKRHPCGIHAQTAIDAALKISSNISTLDDIIEIKIGTYSAAMLMADGPEKWHPQTRETADHSLPYIVAVALMTGEPLMIKHFSDAYLRNSKLLTLLQKVKVEVIKECDDLYPKASANRVEVTLVSGRKYSEIVEYHRGHNLNPLTDSEIEEKFHSLTEGCLSRYKRKKLLQLLWDLENIEDISKVIELMTV